MPLHRPTKRTSCSFREKGSKFLGYLFPAESQEHFDEELDKLKSEYPDATHHCYAWRINPAKLEEFAQDDGEPGGTAGLPILNQLKSYEVINAGIVVVRYYGGTNLGKSGLIQAYGAAAEQCLIQADLSPIQLIRKIRISYPYSEQNRIEKLIHQYNLKELDAHYTETVTLTVGCPIKEYPDLKTRLSQLEHLSIETEHLEKSFI